MRNFKKSYFFMHNLYHYVVGLKAENDNLRAERDSLFMKYHEAKGKAVDLEIKLMQLKMEETDKYLDEMMIRRAKF